MQPGCFWTCDNVWSSALACHFQVFFQTQKRGTHKHKEQRGNTGESRIFLICALSSRAAGFCHWITICFLSIGNRILQMMALQNLTQALRGWKNASQDWRFGIKCQSCELESVQALAMCELDTNWTPELGLYTQSMGVNQQTSTGPHSNVSLM